jgi:hypothetical protein
MWIAIFCIGAYLVAPAFFLRTRNFLSALVFKFIPFVSGFFLMVVSSAHEGWFTNLFSK